MPQSAATLRQIIAPILSGTLRPSESARATLLNFTKFTFPRYVAEPAHALVAAALERAVRGEIKRLMLFMPPQHGKSELCSVRLPAYWLARRPNDPVILTSYGADLAYSKSRQARTLVESTEFRDLFPLIRTRRDSRAVDHWELLPPLRGGMLAAGVGGPITGHGARLGIIDDPVENWQQAQSAIYRDKTWEWWRTTFRPRVWENGIIILIMTRWHIDDLAGRLLAEQGNEWTVMRLTAFAEAQPERDENNRRLGLPQGQADPLGRAPGEPLCPQRYSREELLAIKRDIGTLAWMAQYQGCPIHAEGTMFKREWFQIVEQAPWRARRVRYWDKAATAGGGAWSCGVLLAKGEDGIYYVEDVVRGQWSSHERNAVMKQTADLDQAKYANEVIVWVEQEPGSGGKESAEMTIQLLAGVPVYAETVSGSKDVRLQPFAAQCEAKNVRLVGDNKWNAAYLDELTAIPNGQYRDQSDASGGAFNKLAQKSPSKTVFSAARVVKVEQIFG